MGKEYVELVFAWNMHVEELVVEEAVEVVVESLDMEVGIFAVVVVDMEVVAATAAVVVEVDMEEGDQGQDQDHMNVTVDPEDRDHAADPDHEADHETDPDVTQAETDVTDLVIEDQNQKKSKIAAQPLMKGLKEKIEGKGLHPVQDLKHLQRMELMVITVIDRAIHTVITRQLS